jgi:hypothetical protein
MAGVSGSRAGAWFILALLETDVATSEGAGRDAMERDTQQHCESGGGDGLPDQLGLAEFLDCQQREHD